MAHDPFTLVVALDAAGKAEGDLYLDDGHSFAFTQGAYLHRR
jgi:alpha 1,3-glucosidase